MSLGVFGDKFFEDSKVHCFAVDDPCFSRRDDALVVASEVASGFALFDADELVDLEALILVRVRVQ